jgi:hypothetical protein
VLVAAVRLQARDQLLDVLHAVLRGDQHGVLGLDDHVVLEADGRDQPALANTGSSLRVLGDTSPCVHVAVASQSDASCSAAQEPTSLQPASSGTTTASRGLLHHGVVDRVARQASNAAGPGATKSRSRAAPARGLAQASAMSGAKPLELLEVAVARNRNMPLFQR